MDEETSEKKNSVEGLFDLAIPPGVPVSVIRELVEKFELDLVTRVANVDVIGEIDQREILVLRGDLETVTQAKEYMFEALDRKITEWEKKGQERAKRYKKYMTALSKEEREASSAEDSMEGGGPQFPSS